MAYQPFNSASGLLYTVDNNQFEVLTETRSTFTINLYQNSAEANRVDKTNYLTSAGSLVGSLREECSIIKPSFNIYSIAVPNFNYVYIESFGRYYFVTGITSVNTNVWRIDLEVDVLMSYKTQIKALSAIIGRQENSYNNYLVDDKLPFEKRSGVTVQEISNSVLSNQLADGTHNIVLTVVGA